jgi:hypothetical protein
MFAVWKFLIEWFPAPPEFILLLFEIATEVTMLGTVLSFIEQLDVSEKKSVSFSGPKGRLGRKPAEGMVSACRLFVLLDLLLDPKDEGVMLLRNVGLLFQNLAQVNVKVKPSLCLTD